MDDLYIELPEKWKEVCKELEIQLRDESHNVNCLNMISHLLTQGEKPMGAESIACYLQLHCQISVFVPDLKDSLIKHGIAV